LKYLPKGKEEGEEILMFRKAWEKNTDGALDTLMNDMSTDDIELDLELDDNALIENIEVSQVDKELSEELENES
jgi:hypothetical protein